MPLIAEAKPTVAGDVIDAHVHLFSLPLLMEMAERPETPKRFKQALKEGKWGRRQSETLPDMSAEEIAPWYVERLAAANVAKALIVSVLPDSQYMRDFIGAANGHVHALCNVDPRDPGAPELLEREMAAGFRGVKLYPVNRCYRLSDPACRPFFEKANELKANMIIHYGVTVDPTGDLNYADPLDLSPVARDYPDLSFVIAHFGAGWLDSVLRLAYQCKNVCVDTSGTNNWMDYYVPKMTLAGGLRAGDHGAGSRARALRHRLRDHDALPHVDPLHAAAHPRGDGALGERPRSHPPRERLAHLPP